MLSPGLERRAVVAILLLGATLRTVQYLRSYLQTIGTERERIPDPFRVGGQGEAAAYLYDLSEPTRLASATCQTHRFPDPVTGEPRDLCDGTRVPGN